MGENRHIARAAGLVGMLTMCSRVTGLVRDVVIGYVFGAGVAADAFFVAFRIPNLLRRFVAEGAMGVAFVPVFTDYLTSRSREEAGRVARILFTGMAGALAGLTLVGLVLAPLWVSLFAPGFAADRGKMALTVGLTRWVFPYIFLVSLVALVGAFLNALRHFALPALSPVVVNLVMVAVVLVVCPHLHSPIYGLAYAVLGGGACQLFLLLVLLRRYGFSVRPLWRLSHPAVRRVLALLAPSVFGAAVYQINVMFNTILASVLPRGSVSFLWYADRVFEFPLGVFAVALGTAALPILSAQAARKAYGEMRRSVVLAIGFTNFIAVPAAVGLALLAVPITAVLFGRGAFGREEVVMTAWALQMLAAGLWSVSMVRIIVPALYALRETRAPIIAAAVAFSANAVFGLALMGPVGLDHAPGGEAAVSAPLHAALLGAITWGTSTLGVAELRHAGLALATSLAATVNLLVLAAALSRRLGGLDFPHLLRSLARSVAASVVMAVAVWWAKGMMDWTGPAAMGTKAVALFLTIGVGVVVYGAVAYGLGTAEIESMAQIVRKGRGGIQRKQ